MIDFDRYRMLIFSFFQTHPLAAIGVAVVLIIFFYKKPAETIKFCGICALIVVALYIMSFLTQSGSLGELNKKDAIHRSQDELMK